MYNSSGIQGPGRVLCHPICSDEEVVYKFWSIPSFASLQISSCANCVTFANIANVQTLVNAMLCFFLTLSSEFLCARNWKLCWSLSESVGSRLMKMTLRFSSLNRDYFHCFHYTLIIIDIFMIDISGAPFDDILMVIIIREPF